MGLFALLHDLLPSDVPPGGLFPAIAGIGTGLVALAGFALPPLAALGRVPPLRVLRRDMLPIPSSTWMVYGAALGALGLIMWRLSLDLVLTFALLGGGVVAALVLGGLLLLLLQSLRRLLARASLPWRLGLGQLLRHPLAAAGQSLAFGLILLSMALIALLRGELLDTWQNQLPKNAPNYFALNILPADKQAFTDRLIKLSAQSAPLYPVVPGRLISINGEPVQQIVSKDSARRPRNPARPEPDLGRRPAGGQQAHRRQLVDRPANRMIYPACRWKAKSPKASSSSSAITWCSPSAGSIAKRRSPACARSTGTTSSRTSS